MNDRIKQLAEQAGMRTVTYEYDEDTYFTESLDVQKFAELIVQECANMAESFQRHQYDFTGDLELDEFMKKHFGVEE